MKELVLGTTNVKKRKELDQLLDMAELRIKTLRDFGKVKAVVEDADNFADNAAKKAGEIAQQVGRWTLGEDSGLVVDALDGKPGVYSARYASGKRDDAKNNRKVLREMKKVEPKERTAHYVCAIAIADPEGRVRAAVEGRCDGMIAKEAAGSNGFGYDPIFLIASQNKTYGELPPDFKKASSHRAVAVLLLRPRLKALLDLEEWPEV